jgi:hypothetical protein
MLARHQQEIQANRESGIGSGEGPAEESPPAGRLTDETNYFLFLSTNRPMTSGFRGYECYHDITPTMS